jgi:hypothetical protein
MLATGVSSEIESRIMEEASVGEKDMVESVRIDEDR